MNGYTKIFQNMLESTVWFLSKEARILWITLLLKKDREQMVRIPLPGLAHAARLTVEETELALQELLRPDAYSQSKEFEGRRILERDGGWFVVNGEYYRLKLGEEERREYQRNWQANRRAAEKRIASELEHGRKLEELTKEEQRIWDKARAREYKRRVKAVEHNGACFGAQEAIAKGLAP